MILGADIASNFSHQRHEKANFCLLTKVRFFNEINPLRDLLNNALPYEIADAMKYAAAYEGFILFHILPQGKIFHNP